uniref:Uncharacterized protein n=1 Tax=Cacopsylla melanoneura TaxID=428564 RepID=A0A8D8VDU5_9HEMI
MGPIIFETNYKYQLKSQSYDWTTLYSTLLISALSISISLLAEKHEQGDRGGGELFLFFLGSDPIEQRDVVSAQQTIVLLKRHVNCSRDMCTVQETCVLLKRHVYCSKDMCTAPVWRCTYNSLVFFFFLSFQYLKYS